MLVDVWQNITACFADVDGENYTILVPDIYNRNVNYRQSGLYQADGCLRDYPHKPIFYRNDKWTFDPTKKEKEMLEKKRYAILDMNNSLKMVGASKPEMENEARKYAESYPGYKYYVAEIYAFYQTREPVQRVELA
jgi:hypothetical protein